MIQPIKTIDAHAGGQSLRLVVDGFPHVSGSTHPQRMTWLRRQGDATRRAVVLPPRGHVDLMAAALTEPVSPQADAGIVFMDAAGYPSMSGHGIIAVATIAIERALFFSRDSNGGEARIVFDTPAGAVRADARLATHGQTRRVDAVTMTNVPAFVQEGARAVTVGTRHLRVDLAFGGAFYAIVDTEATGIPLLAPRLPELRRLGTDICAMLNASGEPQHPVNAALNGVAGVIFTGPAQDPEAHLRNVTVSSGGTIDLSPGATGTSAVMVILDAMGLLPDGERFVHEGLSGALLRGRIARRTQVGELPAIVTEIEGSAWITGEHTFFVDEDDPFREGIPF